MTSKQKKLSQRSSSRMATAQMTRIALLSGIAVVLQLLDFALPIFPSFLQIDFSDVPALLAGFAIGPLAGVMVELIKNLIHLLMTTTGGVGELANFIIGCALVIPASMIYKRKKTKTSAAIGLLVGTAIMTVAGALVNYFVLLPFYSSFMPMEAIVELGNVVYSGIVDVKTLVLYGITPFNIFKGFVVSLMTILLYKKVSPVLHSKNTL